MTKRRFCFTFFLLICFSLPLTATAQTVDIPDPNLRAIIANELGKTSGEAITAADMARFGGIRLPNSNIRNLTGLEYATNLRVLNLGAVRTASGFRVNNNFITDISPLARLNNLEELNIEISAISDISPLAGLNNLTKLFLGDNIISDISSLDGLNNLTQLGLERNLISDISPLEGLNNLTFLFFNGNSISDLSPLEGLNNLTWLFLAQNSISDLSPLVANTGLGSGDRVNVTDNPLNSQSINTHIPALQRRGVTVEFDAVIAEPVVIPDLNLRAAIATTLGKASSTVITTADMARLNRLVAPNASISNLTGLEHATNLTRLELGNELVQGNLINSNAITDISVLGQLTDLTYLDLDGNAITNISPLKELTNLTLLGLWSNSVSDISPLAGLTNLRDLNLGYNSISNISVLSGLTNLRGLFLRDNNISDISPLVANTGLGDGDRVWLQENPLNSASITTHIPALQSRGVTVEFDAVITEPVEIPDPNLRAAIARALGKAPGAVINTADMAGLNRLVAVNADISDLTGLEHATNLTALILGAERVGQQLINSNFISDISPLRNLTNLTTLNLWDNNISDISAAAGLTNLIELVLGANSISDISAVAGLTNLTTLNLGTNSISDISSVAGLTNLTTLNLNDNNISDISAVAGLTNLTRLDLWRNSISDISAVAGLTNLTSLDIGTNHVSDISAVSGSINLRRLSLDDNSITSISPLEGLTNLTSLRLGQNNISDISSLVANTGLGSGDRVNVSANPLSSVSINTHIPALQNRGVEVHAENLIPTTLDYTVTIPAGISLIHVPLKVTEVDGREQTIESISDLYDALGGAGTVNFLITYDSMIQEWLSYFVPSDKGTPADAPLSDDTGVIAGLTVPVSVRLSGNPLGVDGSSAITLNPGLNVVGLPLDDPRINRVSDLLTLEGIAGNVPVIILTDGGEFKLVGRAGDPGDVPIRGGQAFILTAQRAATVTISGDGWTNTSGTVAAPPLSLTGIEVGNTTPVLGLRGAIVDQGTGVNQVGLRVTVKNLSTGRTVAAVTALEETGYRLTVVDIETGRAAQIGDTLEISARSRNPFIGVEPLRYTVTAEDVKQSLIQLPELVAYEIPAETQLLANYPNPFNPETWIPYRLAEDAFVTLTIYDGVGQAVRTIEVGHQTTAVYENRSKAIYWDGRNDIGEQVASGIYFYHLSAGDYSATRKMLILK